MPDRVRHDRKSGAPSFGGQAGLLTYSKATFLDSPRHRRAGVFTGMTVRITGILTYIYNVGTYSEGEITFPLVPWVPHPLGWVSTGRSYYHLSHRKRWGTK
jgi:hypothetical protein